MLRAVRPTAAHAHRRARANVVRRVRVPVVVRVRRVRARRGGRVPSVRAAAAPRALATRRAAAAAGPLLRGPLLRGRLRARRVEAEGHDRILRVHPILGLPEDVRLRALHHAVRHLAAALGGKVRYSCTTSSPATSPELVTATANDHGAAPPDTPLAAARVSAQAYENVV